MAAREPAVAEPRTRRQEEIRPPRLPRQRACRLARADGAQPTRPPEPWLIRERRLPDVDVIAALRRRAPARGWWSRMARRCAGAARRVDANQTRVVVRRGRIVHENDEVHGCAVCRGQLSAEVRRRFTAVRAPQSRIAPTIRGETGSCRAAPQRRRGSAARSLELPARRLRARDADATQTSAQPNSLRKWRPRSPARASCPSRRPARRAARRASRRRHDLGRRRGPLCGW